MIDNRGFEPFFNRFSKLFNEILISFPNGCKRKIICDWCSRQRMESKYSI